VDHLRQRLRVPVGEVDAAVRLGPADALRVRSAVDAVVVAETDPRGADRIQGTRGNVEGLLRELASLCPLSALADITRQLRRVALPLRHAAPTAP